VVEVPARASAEAAALARLYDLDLVEDPGDLDLYLALASRTDGSVLELAAGTGRLAIPLAEAGHPVTAVDVDPAMLDRLRARVATAGLGGAGCERLEVIEADLIGLRLPAAGSFGLAFIALNSLFLLATRDAQREAFRTLSSHLAPGATAAVDVWLPDADDLARFDGRLVLEYERVDPETGDVVTKTAAARHDPTTGVVDLTSIYESGAPGGPAVRWIRRDALRLVTPDELRSFAEEAGLRVEQIAGDYDLAALGPGHDRAILIARRQ
jgi:SAM-dependent methyltransferase